MSVINQLHQVILDRRQTDPATSYTASLLASGSEVVAKKLGEESIELVIEATKMSAGGTASTKGRQAFVGEAADLMYHYLVLLVALDVSPKEVEQELQKRSGQSGIEEKQARSQKT